MSEFPLNKHIVGLLSASPENGDLMDTLHERDTTIFFAVAAFNGLAAYTHPLPARF